MRRRKLDTQIEGAVDTPLLTNSQAMAFFKIKTPRVWWAYQRKHKIPFEMVGRQKFFHRDILTRIARKAPEANARKFYAGL